MFLKVLSVVLVLSVFNSCKKDADNSNKTVADINGIWKLVSIDAKTTSSTQSGSIRSVTSTAYITQNNTGTITFTASKLTSNGIGYSVNTTSNIEVYENGILLSKYTMPFAITTPASSSSVDYKRVNNDSIYMQSGSLFMNGTNQDTQAGGARIKLESNKMYIIQSGTKTTTINSQGTSATMISTVNYTATLQRQ